jgi:uncharacterized protein YsxB (DUF464 family)
VITVTLQGVVLSNSSCEWNGETCISVEVSGHAEFSVKGSDIVCAAVSALVQSVSRAAAAKGIVQSQYRDNGQLMLVFDWEPMNDISRRFLLTAFDVMICGLLGVAESYPEYLKIIFVE